MIYTAAYSVNDTDYFPGAEGYGYVEFVKGGSVVSVSRRYFEVPDPTGSRYSSTLIVAEKLSLSSEDVKVRITFYPKDNENITISYRRSIIAIPPKAGYGYKSSTTPHTWTSGTWVDEDTALGPYSGDYLVIYTASYSVKDPDSGEKAYAWGGVKLQKNGVSVSSSLRLYEVPKFDGAYDGTLVTIDKLTLNSESIKAAISFGKSDDEEITVYQRSMIALELKSDYYAYRYKYSTQTMGPLGEGTWNDDATAIDEPLSGSWLALYTAAYVAEDPDLGEDAHGDGWVRFAIDGQNVKISRRNYEVPPKGGRTWQGTLLTIDLLSLDSQGVKAQIHWNLRDNETIELRNRSMVIIYEKPPPSPPPSDDGGGGCPYILVWNGSAYVLDNNLLVASKAASGTDVVDYYLLQETLVEHEDSSYSLMLSEFESEHDFIDQVELLAVDHPSNVNVAVSPYGEILTYAEPSPPVSAIDDDNRNVKHLLSAIDDRYYEGYNGSYIALNFGDLDVSQGAKLVMRADAPVKIYSIHVQVQDEDGNWTTVATVIPRVYWATEIIDMSEHLPDAKGNLKVRLYFTANHKIDFVGLDTSPQATIHVHEGQLISAIHSVDGDVTPLLLYSDDTYAELVPEQQIELKFTLPTQTMETRDYIIITEGHYYTITQENS